MTQVIRTTLFVLMLGYIGLERNVSFAESEEAYITLSNLYKAGKYQEVRKISTRLAGPRFSGNQDKLVGLYFLILLNDQQGLASARNFVERFEIQNAVLTKETYPIFLETFLKAKKEGKYPPDQTVENTLYAYIDNRMPEAYYYVALNYSAKGKYADADLWFTRIMSSYQTDEMFIEFYAVNKVKLGSLDEAVELFTRQAKLNPDNPRPVYNNAAVYAQKGDIERSVHYLEQAIKLSPEYRKKAKLDTDFSKMFTDQRFITLTNE